ncbi:MAG TPA: hypothetical protein VFU08_03900 [Candidatus Udaeobacter sp.]|nr:hypothetical protein [Candidatus Udaeobacter sp.]
MHTSNTGCVPDIPNFFGAGIYENSDRTNSRRYRFDNSPGDLWLNITWTLRVEVESNHIGAEFSARSGIFNIRDTTDLDLHWSHDGENDEDRMTNDELITTPQLL